MAELYVFKTDFEPVMLPGEVVRVVLENDRFDAMCVGSGALPEYEKDFGALSSTITGWNSNSQYALIDQYDNNMKMNDFEISQLRMRVVDYMYIRLNNLGTTRQWRTANVSFALPQFPTGQGEDFLKQYLFKASEFFVYHDDLPHFDLFSDFALTASRVLFSGWRYRIQKVKTPSTTRPPKVIWVSGWPSGSEMLNL